MKTLETIQKTCRVMQRIVQAAYILCMIGAAALAVGALCAGAQYRGGYVFLIRHEPLQLFPDGTDLMQKSVKLLSAALALTGGTLLLGMTHRCLRAEQAEGTPFTVRGAERIRKLGVRFIYIPVIADAVSGRLPSGWEERKK